LRILFFVIITAAISAPASADIVTLWGTTDCPEGSNSVATGQMAGGRFYPNPGPPGAIAETLGAPVCIVGFESVSGSLSAVLGQYHLAPTVGQLACTVCRYSDQPAVAMPGLGSLAVLVLSICFVGATWWRGRRAV